MSYILEALRRAEAQRSITQAPDLQRQIVAAAAPQTAGSAHQRLHRRTALIVLLALALLAAGAATTAWILLMLRDSPRVTNPSVAPAPLNPGPSAAIDRAPDRAALESTELSSAPPAADATRLDLPRDAVVLAEAPKAPPTSVRSALKTDSAAAATAPERASPLVARSAATTAAPAASAQGAAVPSRAELPPELRRTLPPISIGGTVYSADPTRRMLIVDGELWREGDQVRPDLVIEQIRPRDAVLRYRGVRFSVAP